MSAIDDCESENITLEVLAEPLPLPSDKVASSISNIVQPIFDLLSSIVDWIYPVNSVTGEREFWYIPVFVENFMGSVMYPSMCWKQGGAITHLFSDKVAQITENLAAHAKRDLDYEVTILNNNVVNAWCLPGGKIAVYRLLLEKIDYYVHNKLQLGLNGYTDPETGTFISYKDVTTDDVIAALIGHEMTHADARHAARKLELTFFVQLSTFALDFFATQKLQNWEEDLKIRSTLQQEDPEQIRKEKQELSQWKSLYKLFFGWISPLATQLYFLLGSRNHELEADRYGTQLAIDAGYNPAGALFLQEILKNESHSLYDFLPQIFQEVHELFQSHPPCEMRQREIYMLITQ